MIAAVVLAIALPHLSVAQVFMSSSLNVQGNPNHKATATCETSGNDENGTPQSTANWGYEFTAVCTVTGTDGTEINSATGVESDPSGNLEADLSKCEPNPDDSSNPLDQLGWATQNGCSFTFNMTPGVTYTLTTKHYVWLPIVPCGNRGPCGLQDPQDWEDTTEQDIPNDTSRTAQEALDPSQNPTTAYCNNNGCPGDATKTIPVGTPPTYSGAIWVGTTHAVLTAVKITSAQTGSDAGASGLFQTQNVQFSSNLAVFEDLNNTDNFSWCLQDSNTDCPVPGSLPGLPGIGGISNAQAFNGSLAPLAGMQSTFVAPSQLSTFDGGATVSLFVCAQETLLPANFECDALNLVDLQIFMTPSGASLLQGQTQSFSAYLNTSPTAPVPGTVSSWQWNTAENNDQGSKSSGNPQIQGTEYVGTYGYKAPPQNQQDTLTLTASVGDTLAGTSLTVTASAPIIVSSSLQSQTITFGAIAPQVANTTVALNASSSSGLPVQYVVSPSSVCTLSGASVVLLSGGGCSVTAMQSGNRSYAAAASGQTFTVNLATQAISFNGLPSSVPFDGVDATVGVTASASSGLPVSLSSLTPSVCAVSTAAASLLSPGTCTIQASQGGNAMYAPASATASFTVEAPSQQAGWNFEATNVGSAGAPVVLTFSFSSSVTLGTISVLTEGVSGLDFSNAGTGNCSGGSAYNAGQSCTVSVGFAPTTAGARYGVVVLIDGSGNVISTAYVQGIGISPLVAFLPGTQGPLQTSPLQNPQGLAVDGAGDVYVVDSGNARILKETPANGNYTESTVTTTALSQPSLVAVDGRGTLYIADSGNNRILMETPTSGSFTESTVPTSALSYPMGVAVDGNGDVYIADSGNNRVIEEALSAGSYTESMISTSSLNFPDAVAVDASRNVYIADEYNNRVLKETLSGSTYSESTVPTSPLQYPAAVVVDGLGNLYITDFGNGRVLKETPSSGSYVESSVFTNPPAEPVGVAVDGYGNIYATDYENSVVLKEDYADPPSLTFQPTAPGSASSDSPQTITIANTGDSSLTLPVPASGTNPSISANFALTSSGSTSCPVVSSGSSTAGPVSVGQSCQLLVSFTPTVTGALTGNLVLTDNAPSPAAQGSTGQSISLNGIGTGSTAQSISFGTITAQIVQTSLSLTATATSSLPVTFISTTPGICTVSGTAASLTAYGSCTIEATQPGNAEYAAAPPVAQSFAVNPLAQTISFTAIPDQSLDTTTATALSAYATSGLPVNLTSSTPAVCSISDAAVSLLASGTCTIEATQSGNSIYSPAPNVLQSFSVIGASSPTQAFGSVTIGTSSSAIPVTVTFNTTATLGGVALLTGGVGNLDFSNGGTGSCTSGTPYNAGDSCTVAVKFTPSLPGTRVGAVVATDGNGNVIGTSYVAGKGLGPQLNFLPGTEVALQGWSEPSAIVVDAAGAIYAVDGPYIFKETPSGSNYVSSTLPSPSGTVPFGLAVDGAGNVYVGDDASGTIMQFIPNASGYTETAIPIPSLGCLSANGIAVDGGGNLYIVDPCNDVLHKETLSAGTYSDSAVPTSVQYPSGVAVDPSGNLYIADYSDDVILKETIYNGTYSESTVPTSALSDPSGLTVDSEGNLYIADSGNRRVLKEIPAGGGYLETTVSTSSLNFPRDVAVDGGGDIDIADTYNGRLLKEDLTDAPSLTFGAAATGSVSSDSPQTITLQNAGNAILTFPVPASGNNPSLSADFALNTTGSSACPLVSAGSSNPGTLAAGQTCALPVSFVPTDTGALTGALVITDTAPNSSFPGSPAQQSITLNGTAAAGTAQTVTFNSISQQVAGTSVTLTASATSGLTVIFSSDTPSACTVAGTVASLVATGTCTIEANQPGSTVYSAAPTVTQSFNVLPVNVQFGVQSVGTTSTTNTTEFTFAAATTLGSYFVLTDGIAGLDFADAGTGTCASGTAYSAGSNCTVNLVFTPTRPGVRYGAVVLTNSSGTVVATSYLLGSGTGAQLSFQPGTEATLPTGGLGWPAGVATDGSGSVYIVDSGNGAIIKETSGPSGYSQSTISTSALNNPQMIALDGAGNLYIADAGNNRVLKETWSGSSYSETTISTSPLNDPSGVAVDGNGNVYIADTGNNRVLFEAASAGSYSETVIQTSPLNSPYGVAVDGNGNVYIADTYDKRVLKETLQGTGYTESAIPTSPLAYPAGLALDGAGDLYIADFDNNRVLRETGSLSGYTESTVSTSPLSYPTAVAIDGNDNVYVTDTGHSRVLEEDMWDPPNLSFATTAVGSTSADSPQTITVANVGNTTLTFSSIIYPADFPESSGVTSDCSGTGTLAAASTCTLTINFSPTSALSSGQTSTGLTETVQLTSNAVNGPGTPESISLSGTETAPVAATPTFSVPAGTYASTQTVTISDSTPGATIYFTTDGTTPTTSSTVYTGPITVSASEMLNAVAVASGYSASSLATVAYTISGSGSLVLGPMQVGSATRRILATLVPALPEFHESPRNRGPSPGSGGAMVAHADDSLLHSCAAGAWVKG
jgi:sugar lactone lactonase YvrE